MQDFLLPFVPQRRLWCISWVLYVVQVKKSDRQLRSNVDVYTQMRFSICLLHTRYGSIVPVQLKNAQGYWRLRVQSLSWPEKNCIWWVVVECHFWLQNMSLCIQWVLSEYVLKPIRQTNTVWHENKAVTKGFCLDQLTWRQQQSWPKEGLSSLSVILVYTFKAYS